MKVFVSNGWFIAYGMFFFFKFIPNKSRNSNGLYIQSLEKHLANVFLVNKVGT